MQSRRAFCQTLAATALSSSGVGLAANQVKSMLQHVTGSPSYLDGRPGTTRRLNASDAGPIIHYGNGPNRCDYLGAREAICFKADDTYYLYYDGAGPKGWLACLATSSDLHHWDLKGPALDFGAPGDDDSATASSPWIVFDGSWWHMFYVGSRRTSPPPYRVPEVPYFTLTAKSKHPGGPWIKEKHVVPFRPKPGTYYSDSASPGQIVQQGNGYMMFFSAAAYHDKMLKRTLSIARTRNLDGPWQLDTEPILPPAQQVENTALYFEPSNATWFLFTNHIGIDDQGEFTDGIWVYWSKNLNKWNAENRAVVLDKTNCHWAVRCIGMPSVVKVGKRLALFYDGATDNIACHMRRDIGLAWLHLPLRPPS